MRYCLLFLFVGFISFFANAQHYFTLNSFVGKQEIFVNGWKYIIDSIGKKVKTNYPRFDTLIFASEGPNWGELVICNFKPDTVYSITGACCASLDIIPASKFKCDSLRYWDAEKDFYKIQNVLRDKPVISIRTKKYPKSVIYAWHADATVETNLHNKISTTPWRLGVPPKGFYWNNITHVMFYKIDAKSSIKRKDLEGFLGSENIVELATIGFRLFDNHNFILIFDEDTREIKLQYEK